MSFPGGPYARRGWLVAGATVAMLGSYTSMTARAPVSAGGAAGAPGPMISPTLRGAAGDAQDGNEAGRARDQVTAAERAFGGAAPETARALASLAHVLWGREEFDAALPCAERALAIRLANPADADLIGVSQYQVADLRRATGDYAGALLAYRRAIAIWEKTRAPDDSSVGDALHYLGVVDGAIGDTESARASLARALRIREARLGPWHQRVAVTLLALGDLGARAGDASAAGLFARAQAIAERALGVDDPLVARGLSGRAAVLAAAGRLGEAMRLVDRALAIRIKAFGPAHHLVGRSRADRAGLLALAGDAPAAEREYSAAIDIETRALGSRHSFVGAMLAALSRVQWAAGQHARALVTALEAEDIARDTFRRSSRDLDDEAVLRYGTVRDSGLDVALTSLTEAIPPDDVGRATGTTAREVADALIRSRALALDVLTRAAPAPDPPGEPAAAPADAGPGFEEVRRALPAGSALAAFARFDRIAASQEAAIPTYVALVLRPESDEPATIPIGPATRIDALVAAWRAAAGTDPRSLPDRGADRLERAAGEGLREAIWDPLADALAGADRVFIVADGAIDGVNIAALPSGDGGYLIESGPLLHSLTAERDIVRKRGSARIGKGILVVGDPDFDAPGALGVVAAANGAAGPSPAGARPECPEFADLVFEPLPGSAVEADAIAAVVPDGGVLRLGGAAATRASFVEDAPGRRILHLATHAYVLPERCGAHRPLLRSGLAFASANRRAGSGGVAGVGDGILTAEEIATLDLSGVEWVVLSACDTGLGEVRAGEGVVGLRHAFERAGAGTVIMSLWDVDDGAAGAFMRELYAGRRSGLSTSEAMRQAGLGILARQRALGRSTHPYFWGGFTAVGDWR